MAPAILPQLQLVSKDELPPHACCIICLNRVSGLAVKLSCGHAIAVDCTEGWLNAGNLHACRQCDYDFRRKNERSSFVSRLDPRSTTRRGDEHETTPSAQSGPIQPARQTYLPYRPTGNPSPVPTPNQTPSPSSNSPTPISPHTRTPHYQPPPTTTTTTPAATPTPITNKRAHSNIFIPAEFGLPPSTFRLSLATLTSPPRTQDTQVPASLLAGHGRNDSAVSRPQPSRMHGCRVRDGEMAVSPVASSRGGGAGTGVGSGMGYRPYRAGSCCSSVSSLGSTV